MKTPLLTECNAQFAQGVIRGALVWISSPGKTLLADKYGYRELKHCLPLGWSTLFDMADITMAIGTGTLLAHLHTQGLLDFDAPLTACLPEFRGNTARGVPTLRQLATHTSGLDSSRPYNAHIAQGDRLALLDAVLALDVLEQPGTRFQYSDANGILLGFVIEKLAGMSLDALAQKLIFDPLGMPCSSWGIALPQCRDNMARHPLRGTLQPPRNTVPYQHWEYHEAAVLPADETARWSYPRAIGSAGIFSTGDDLKAFGSWLLGDAAGISQESRMELFRTCTPAGLPPRSIAWDRTPLPGLSPAVISHTGRSGQSYWLDPEKQLIVAILTTPAENYQENQEGRRRLAQAALRELDMK